MYIFLDNYYAFAETQSETQRLLTLWDPIWFIPTAISLPYLPHSWSSRLYITLSSAVICIASMLKTITTCKPYALILAHAVQIINGIAGPFVLSTTALISSEWFPINQRLFAISIAVSAHYLGTFSIFDL